MARSLQNVMPPLEATPGEDVPRRGDPVRERDFPGSRHSEWLPALHRILPQAFALLRPARGPPRHHRYSRARAPGVPRAMQLEPYLQSGQPPRLLRQHDARRPSSPPTATPAHSYAIEARAVKTRLLAPMPADRAPRTANETPPTRQST